jgi:hypothetical protein
LGRTQEKSYITEGINVDPKCSESTLSKIEANRIVVQLYIEGKVTLRWSQRLEQCGHKLERLTATGP